MGLSFLLFNSVAMASGLQWQWPAGETVHYQIEARMLAPHGREWKAERNKAVRVSETRLSLNVGCSGEMKGKTWSVACSLDQVDLNGASIRGRDDLVEAVLGEYAAELSGKEVTFRLGTDGRVRGLDLKGVETRNRNHAVVIEGARQMLQQAFIPFDLQLPKKGDDKGKKWSQKGSPMVFQQSGSEGTAGGVSLKHKVASRDGETVRVESSGRAAVIPGNTVEMGTNSMLRINSTGNTQFNTALGLMDWALVSTDSDHAVSNMAGLSMVKPDSFKVSLGRISESGALLKPPPEPKPETP